MGVVTFGSMAATAIPLRVDGDKCQLIKDFTTVTKTNPDVGIYTSTSSGVLYIYLYLVIIELAH